VYVVAGETSGAAGTHLIFMRGCCTRGMQQRETPIGRRIRDRDAALRRLWRTTALAVAGTATLAAAFGGLAARGFPGRSHKAAPVVARRQVTVRGAATHVVAPPPLVSAGSALPTAPAPPPPVATQAQPVAVSGGS
jgi:hypothetical protein